MRGGIFRSSVQKIQNGMLLMKKKNLGGGGGIGGLYKSYKCIKVFCPPIDFSASDENISALPKSPKNPGQASVYHIIYSDGSVYKWTGPESLFYTLHRSLGFTPELLLKYVMVL